MPTGDTNIVNETTYQNSRPIWHHLLPDMKHAPTDIDGEYERNGRLLTIETKAPGVPLNWNTGQMRALTAKANKPDQHVIIAWTTPTGPVQHIQIVGKNKHKAYDGELNDLVTKWWT